MSCEISVMGEGRSSLAGELCVFHAAALKPRLLAIATAGVDQEIDLAQVSEVDTAGVQLLLLAKREAARAGGRLFYVNHSEAVLEALTLLNLAPDFGDPVFMPAEKREFR
ncbi:lipid asymmetry maintenance protein MlaB [Stutzerimonas sp. VN223-3]|uniref:STAS domain-containing protein n=1 Tax=Stutzerimonas sp. VN223-3 TaxID=3384601 RepID=UPI0038B53FBF